MASFASVADLEAFLAKDFAAGAETIQAQAALDTATAEIKAWTGQTIEQASDTVVLDPNAAGVVFLPQVPVTAVSAVSVDGTALTVASDVDWYSYGALYRDDNTTWGTERQTVSVTYTHGYATIPDDLKRVCVKRAARILAIPMLGGPAVTTDAEGNINERRWSMSPLDGEEAFDEGDRAVMSAYKVYVVA